MNISRGHSREPHCADLIHSVDDEATCANDSLFTKGVFIGYVDRNNAEDS